tara:strand:- start:325 stop:819 length:495 start_codon:yes stop_codon:yes gene_type:complete
MSGMGRVGGFSANVPASAKSSTIRTQVTDKITEKIHGKVDEKLKSAGVSEGTREALLGDVTQVIERQMSSGGLPDPKAMRESIGGIFEKHGLSLPDGLEQGTGKLGFQGGYTGTGAADGSQFDLVQSLIEKLQAESDGINNQHTSADQYADALVSRLLGVDFRA